MADHIVTTFAELLTAVANAGNSDRILLADGTFTATADVNPVNKSLTITSQSNNESSVIIDFDETAFRFIFDDAEDDNSTMSYLTFKNAKYTHLTNFTGPITISGGSPTIEYCTFDSNITDDGYNSACIGIRDATPDNLSPIIDNCTFIKNTAGDVSDVRTKAGLVSIYAASGSTGRPVISNCTFGGSEANKNYVKGTGVAQDCGLIVISEYAKPIINDCKFSYTDISCPYWSANILSSGFGGGTYNDLEFSYNTVSAGLGSGIGIKFSHQHGAATCNRINAHHNTTSGTGNSSSPIFAEYCMGGVNEGKWITINDSRFENNEVGSANAGYDSGSGIMVYRGSGVILNRCLFKNNTIDGEDGAALHVHGGGTIAYDSDYPGDPLQTTTTCYANYCKFVNNSAVNGLTGAGGAAVLGNPGEDAILYLNNCSFNGNTSTHTDNASDILTESNATGSHSIIVNNSILNSAAPGWKQNTNSTITITNSLLNFFKIGAGNVLSTSETPTSSSIVDLVDLRDYAKTASGYANFRVKVRPSKAEFFNSNAQQAGKIRIRVDGPPSGTEPTYIYSTTFGVCSAGDDFDAAPTRITWDGGNNTKTIAVGATAYSDWITFNWNGVYDYLFHFTLKTAAARNYFAAKNAWPGSWNSFQDVATDSDLSETQVVVFTGSANWDLLQDIQLAVTPDPLFADTTNLNLQHGSPAKDVGDNTAWAGTASVTDYSGKPITDAGGTVIAFGGTVDLGAEEYIPGGGGLSPGLGLSGGHRPPWWNRRR